MLKYQIRKIEFFSHDMIKLFINSAMEFNSTFNIISKVNKRNFLTLQIRLFYSSILIIFYKDIKFLFIFISCLLFLLLLYLFFPLQINKKCPTLQFKIKK